MFNDNEKKPCLVKLERGFSVNYQNRFLYSKYAPEKNILSVVENLEILPGTIILCFSPVLKYGIEELAKKLKENCIMFGIEYDPELYEIAKSETKNLECSKNGTYILVPRNEVCFLPERIERLCRKGTYKRVISIEFSGGFYFNAKFYINLFETCRNTASQFWKNRITLVKFGRKYSANLFKNLQYIPQSLKWIKTEKPIIVAGAGESCEKTLIGIKKEREKYFIIAVDAVLKTLKALKIKADAAVCEESQTIISKAFSGCKNQFDYLFLSTTAANSVTRIAPQKNIFYTPRFENTEFLKNLENSGILENIQQPLGSVGLSATEIALKIRKTSDIPIFVTGLDFSYSIGKTHAKNSFPENVRRAVSSKLCGIDNFSASFGNDSTKIIGKNGRNVITTTALSGYAELFKFKFAGKQNLFDSGESGIYLGLQKKNPFSLEKKSLFCENSKEEQNSFNSEKSAKIKEYLKQEKTALLELKAIFTGKKDFSESEKNKKIEELLEAREYLYLHFPDGYKINFSQNFLNRVRVELDYFLKIFK